MRVFYTNLNQIWKTWDYSATQVQSKDLGADTEGKRITFGQNNGLYLLGKTDGQIVGSYTLGEMAILGLTSDYKSRTFWTPLTQTSDSDSSVDSINGFAVTKENAVIFGTVKQADVFTISDAIQSSILGGTENYLATWSI